MLKGGRSPLLNAIAEFLWRPRKSIPLGFERKVNFRTLNTSNSRAFGEPQVAAKAGLGLGAHPLSSRNTKPALPFVRFDYLEPTVRKEIEHSMKEKKLHLMTLPRFSALLNGLRPGELTIFTGPTGCGKTTVLSQISIDYCLQGLPVLWGSFEIRNTRLAQTMLQQIAMQPLVSKDSLFNEPAWKEASDRLRASPMNFMNTFGSTSLDAVLDAMDISMQQPTPPGLIILDNLQFMLSGQATNAIDKWELMDRAIANLRAFCNAYKTHVILVVHPRKEIDETPLGIASVSGTAKATQEADNVIILQKLGDKRYLELKKNRYYGDLGRVRIGYLPESRIVTEATEEENAPQSRYEQKAPPELVDDPLHSANDSRLLNSELDD